MVSTLHPASSDRMQRWIAWSKRTNTTGWGWGKPPPSDEVRYEPLLLVSIQTKHTATKEMDEIDDDFEPLSSNHLAALG